MGRKQYSGADAWRNHFSVNAADLLQIVRWANDWDLEMFLAVLTLCWKRRPRSERVNEATVLHVLHALHLFSKENA